MGEIALRCELDVVETRFQVEGRWSYPRIGAVYGYARALDRNRFDVNDTGQPPEFELKLLVLLFADRKYDIERMMSWCFRMKLVVALA